MTGKKMRILKDDARQSLIGQEDSTALKAILILIVILGHNRYLMGVNDMLPFRFLYSFHVYAFFLLPFLYNHHHQPFVVFVMKNIKRFGVPYMVVFAALFAMSLPEVLEYDVWTIVKAFLRGSFREIFGFGGAFWFIPSMFLLLCVKQLYYESGLVVRILLIILSGLCMSAHAFSLPVELLQVGGVRGIAMLPLGIALRYVVKKRPPYMSKWPNLLFFAVLVLFMATSQTENPCTYLTIVRMICPVVMMLFFMAQTPAIKKVPLLMEIGNKTFPIYIIHIFVYQLFYRVIDRIFEPGLALSIVLLFAVTGVSFLISKSRVIKYVFPR